MSSSRYVHLDVDLILKRTDKALLLRVGDAEHWIPLSQIADADDFEEGDENCTVSITDWIANERGLS